MITFESAARLTALKNKIDGVTGDESSTLSEAVDNALAGYGQGGGNTVQIGQDTPVPNFINMFYALEQGTSVSGTFMVSAPLSEETLIFSSGLSELHGVMLINTDRTEYGDIEGVFFGCGLLSNGELSLSLVLPTKTNVAPLKTSFIVRGNWRIDGGDLYVTPTFANNSTYTPFLPNETYRWVAW